MEKAKLITSEDVAKFLGVEKEYKDALIEQELKITRENFMNSEFEPAKNNCIENSINNEKQLE